MHNSFLYRCELLLSLPKPRQMIIIHHNICMSILADTDTRDCHLEQPPIGDIFPRKIDDILKDLPNIFCIVNDI